MSLSFVYFVTLRHGLGGLPDAPDPVLNRAVSAGFVCAVFRQIFRTAQFRPLHPYLAGCICFYGLGVTRNRVLSVVMTDFERTAFSHV